MRNTIYKIVTRDQWNDARHHGVFRGSAVDQQDGYIHFSSGQQLAQTAAKYFAGQRGLLILKVPTEPLDDNLRWEESRGGTLFPHLYGELPCNLVADVFELPLTSDGVHILPDECAKTNLDE